MGHHGPVRPTSLPNPVLRSIPAVTLVILLGACGRKGDPVPRPRARPAACEAQWKDLRLLEVRLPRQDVQGGPLVGIEKLRLVYLPLGHARPSAGEVLARGEEIQERRRPDLPRPGQALHLNLRDLGRPAGWMVVVAVRVGDVVGEPSEPLAWLDPRI